MESPKKRFQEEKGNAEEWNKLSGLRIFEKATDAALLSYVASIPAEDHSGYAKIQGAQQFLKTLCSIGRIESTPVQKPIGQLNYQPDAQPKKK